MARSSRWRSSISEPIHELDASQLRAHYARGELTPLEVAEHLLERIERSQPRLHAFITVTGELALGQARDATARWQRVRRGDGAAPPLLGVPVTIKDLIDVRGVPTTMGSLVTSRAPAERDEIAVERLRAAGALILGKTNTSEFGLAAQTINRLGPAAANPHDLTRTPGGSSGGAAAGLRGRPGAAAPRHRRRRLGPPAGRLLRRGGTQADDAANSAPHTGRWHGADRLRRRDSRAASPTRR